MNLKQRNQYILKATKRRMKILSSKGRDYSISTNAFDNFNRGSRMLGLDRKIVLWVYFMKHIDAISNFISKGKLESEPIQGRLDDARNYLDILDAMIKEENDDEEDIAREGYGIHPHSYGSISTFDLRRLSKSLLLG